MTYRLKNSDSIIFTTENYTDFINHNIENPSSETFIGFFYSLVSYKHSSFKFPFEYNNNCSTAILFNKKSDFLKTELLFTATKENFKYIIDKNNILDLYFDNNLAKNPPFDIMSYLCSSIYLNQIYKFATTNKSYDISSLTETLINQDIISEEQINKYQKDISIEALLSPIGLIGTLYNRCNQKLENSKQISLNDQTIDIKDFQFSLYLIFNHFHKNITLLENNDFSAYEYNTIQSKNYFEQKFDLTINFPDLLAPATTSFPSSFYKLFDKLLPNNSNTQKEFFSHINNSDLGAKFLTELCVYKPELLNYYLDKHIYPNNSKNKSAQMSDELKISFLSSIFTKNNIEDFPALLKKYPQLGYKLSSLNNLDDIIESKDLFVFELKIDISKILQYVMPDKKLEEKPILAKFLLRCFEQKFVQTSDNVWVKYEIASNSLTSYKNFKISFSSENKDYINEQEIKNFLLKIIKHPDLKSFYNQIDFTDSFVRSVLLELSLENVDKTPTSHKKSKKI